MSKTPYTLFEFRNKLYDMNAGMRWPELTGTKKGHRIKAVEAYEGFPTPVEIWWRETTTTPFGFYICDDDFEADSLYPGGVVWGLGSHAAARVAAAGFMLGWYAAERK